MANDVPLLADSVLLEKAKQHCERRLANEPENRSILRSLAEVCLKQRNRAEAAVIYDRLFQLEQDQGPGGLQIDSYMNPSVFRDEGALRRIGAALVAGRLVVVRNAAQEAFAETMFQCLDTFSDWRMYEGYEKHFNYRHHNIYDKNLYPLELAWCEAVLLSQATKDLVQRLSGRDCSGEATFSASWYRPGDYSLPHNDRTEEEGSNCRQLAFVWHLAKNWSPTWGGDLYWCPADRYFTPVFNTLMLFTVRPESMHFVTQVSPLAKSKRLAINGWWTGQDSQSAAARLRRKQRSEESVEILNEPQGAVAAERDC